MARTFQFRKAKLAQDEKSDAELLAHIKTLGLKTVDEYRDWCDRHGFSRRTQKHWRQRMKERAYATRAAAEARLSQKKKELRHPEKVIERIFRGELPDTAVTQPHLSSICRAYEASKQCQRTKRALLRLLLHVSKHAEFFSTAPVIAELGRQAGNTFVDGLAAVARHAPHWIRPVEEWRPRTHNCRRQFASLVRHLFARWPVPAFMDSVWFLGNSNSAARQQGWFLHLGRGESIRTADLPVPYTKRMAHYFLQAPPDVTVTAALRWGQIHALGGNERLFRAVVGTHLGEDFEHDDFWVTVLRFLIANPMLDTAHVGPVIHYIRHQRFVSQEVFVAPGVIERKGPPQPHFSMKGRRVASLLRQVEAWHGHLAKIHQPLSEWPRCGIDGLEFIEGSEQGGNLKIWTITELLSTKALVAEGRTLKHCVATYARSCAHGECSIWTMEVESFEGRRKVLTIEVNLRSRMICQARGKCNAVPGEKHRAILRRWATQVGLGIASYL